MNVSKEWYQSFTVWLNVLTVVLMVLMLPEVMAIVPREWLPIVTAINASGNLILRLFKTAQPIAK